MPEKPLTPGCHKIIKLFPDKHQVMVNRGEEIERQAIKGMRNTCLFEEEADLYTSINIKDGSNNLARQKSC